MAQTRGADLATALKARDQHITLYSGYTLEELYSTPNPYIASILEHADILIDGPFIKELTDNAGEWRGSTNQRIIYNPATCGPGGGEQKSRDYVNKVVSSIFLPAF